MEAFARETLEFATALLGASWATIHLFDAQGSFVWLGNRHTPEAFRTAYYASNMHTFDPLNVPRLQGDERGIVGLEDVGGRHGPYHALLSSFAITDAAEMLFSDSGRLIGGMSLIWTRHAGITLRQIADMAANVHRYIDANYRRAWSDTVYARRWRMAQELGLTPREAEVTELVCLGMTNEEIASCLNASLSTIKCHLNHVFRKVGVTNRTGLLQRAQGAPTSPSRRSDL